jgi:hypothetical protein
MLKYLGKALINELGSYLVVILVVGSIYGAGVLLDKLFGEYAGAVAIVIIFVVLQGTILWQEAEKLKAKDSYKERSGN